MPGQKTEVWTGFLVRRPETSSHKSKERTESPKDKKQRKMKQAMNSTTFKMAEEVARSCKRTGTGEYDVARTRRPKGKDKEDQSRDEASVVDSSSNSSGRTRRSSRRSADDRSEIVDNPVPDPPDLETPVDVPPGGEEGGGGGESGESGGGETDHGEEPAGEGILVLWRG